jgi:anti-sigma regulatory factor (Ser/Thr protein kinase)
VRTSPRAPIVARGDYLAVPRWKVSFPATPEAGYVLRGEMAAIARRCGLGHDRIGDVKLAVSEAVSNAVRHAYRGEEPGDVIATAHVENGVLRIVIADTGSGMARRSDSPGAGLGLPLIAHAADTVEVVRKSPGTEIHMTFPCPASAHE